MAAQQHRGTFKWYNRKSGFGFIRDSEANQDFFVPFSGLMRSFRKVLLRKGDNATFTTFKGKKGPEAREVTREGKLERPPSRPKSSPGAGKPAEADLKIKACICTAQVLAGNNTRRLQTLIPVHLKHNGLPAITIPEEAFTTTRHRIQKTKKTRQLPKEEPHHEDRAEERTGNEEEEAEDEVVDVVGTYTSLHIHTTDLLDQATASPAPEERQTKGKKKATPDAATTTKNISLWDWDISLSHDEAPPTKNYFLSCKKLIADMMKCNKTSDSSDNQDSQSKKKRHQRR
ncbi:Cold shock-like protein CspA [Portunus trituberculatus]|uniref:Cold shock-like protein CspA n=1 Tax=Portunus trituberculatus TaxID=210409 RepID=A0A5B7GZU9_PORTR|nr:Cold shock-like protein CspA [Portunus trituberculatus]